MALTRNQKKRSEPLTIQQQVDRYKCLNDYLFFVRYFFKQRYNIKFKLNWHHYLFADTLMKIYRGELQNVVINVPPGSSKTEMIVINFMAWSLAKNPWCRFLHLSYADDLALLNSQTSRDIVSSDEYQAMWHRPISDDDRAKKRWNVVLEDGKKAGGVYAVALGGQITGFRAGHMIEGFNGALIIDDPLKPEDAFSEPKLRVANRRLVSTVKSRLANPRVPIIVIMQRIAQGDPTDFIVGGNLGIDFHHIVIPAIIDDAYINGLDPKYQEMILCPGA